MSYKVVSGVCRPQTFEALEQYKGVQRETNRLLDMQDAKLLYVDGRIGDKTRLAINKVLGTSFKTCSEIADRIATLWVSLKGLAESSNAAVVADPESPVRSVISPPSKYNAATNKVVHPSISTAGIAGVPLWAIALFGAGGAYYFRKTKSGKKQWKSLTGGF